VLRAEGYEGFDGWVVAALDITAEKLSALRKPNCVEARGEFRDRREVVAYCLQLDVDVAEEGSGTVGRAGRRNADWVDKGRRVEADEVVTDGLDSVRVERVACDR
jgi:hypothetical protein